MPDALSGGGWTAESLADALYEYRHAQSRPSNDTLFIQYAHIALRGPGTHAVRGEAAQAVEPEPSRVAGPHHGDLIGREEVAQAIYAANGGCSGYDKSIHGSEFWLRAADAAIAALRALPSPPQGVVVAEGVARASSRCLIIDVDAANNRSIYFDFDAHPQLRPLDGQRVRVWVEKAP